MGKSIKPRFKLIVENMEPRHFVMESDAREAYQQVDQSLVAMIMIRSKKNWQNYMGRELGYSRTYFYEKHPFYVDPKDCLLT